MVIDDILAAREARRELIARISDTGAVVTVKANIPGVNKNTPHALLCSAYFARLAEQMGVYDFFSDVSADGRCFIGRAEDAAGAKAQLSAIEEGHPIGRLIDMDVTDKGAEASISRGSMRRCFLCGEAAFVCSRRGGHKRERLIEFFNKRTEEFFSSLMADYTLEAIMAELMLTDKFGLVSPVSTGSHPDLDCAVMRRGAEAIYQTLAECFTAGLTAERPEGLLSLLRPIGIRCEEAMLLSTEGANAYKGFIFVGGALLAASGYALGRGESFSEIYKIAARICEDIDTGMPKDTFGHKASLLGFGGIRAEAKAGFPTVKYAEERLSSGCAPLKLLTEIVGRAEDSVLLKRAGGMEAYEYYKRLISSTDTENTEELKKVNALCESEGISIGGSADILIAAVLMQKIRNAFLWG